MNDTDLLQIREPERAERGLTEGFDENETALPQSPVGPGIEF